MRIKPGPLSEQTIHCEIVHRRKSSKMLKYEALSYTWGSASNVKSIKIGQELSDFSVTSNCFDALRRLRYEKKTRLVWIDALCINQKDGDERIKQVRIMGKIYSQARRVVVYLGEADEASRLLLRHIRNDYNSVTDMQKFISSCPAMIFESARVLLKRPWFDRVWIIQEVLSSPSDVLVVCGADKAAWPDFAGCCTELCRSNAEDYSPYTYGMPYVLCIGAGDEKGSLLEILCRTRPSDATDPRDKFFGVLSLVRNEDTICRLASAATYDQSTTIIYTEIGLYLLRKDKLVMLQAIRHPHSKFPNLASWIPDWSRTDENDPFWLDIPQDDSHFDNLNFVLEFCTFECC